MKIKKINNKGFTLIELLVAMTILAIITAMAIPLLRNLTGSATNKKYETFKDSIVYASKLFVDSYSEDLFDNRESGCAYIDLDTLIERRLAKDIEMENVSCKTTKTYVQVVKLGEQYTYTPYITCGTINENGVNNENGFNYPEGEHTKDDDSCGFESNFNINIIPSEGGTEESFKKKEITLTINSYTGINPNVDMYYAFSYNSNAEELITEWRKFTVKVPSVEKQKTKVLAGESISVKTGAIATPDNADGDLFLITRINNLTDLYGESWTKIADKYAIYGPYRIDNSSPVINNLTVYNESGNWYFNTQIQDETNFESYYRLCPDNSRIPKCSSISEFTYDTQAKEDNINDYISPLNDTYKKWVDFCAKVTDHAGNISEMKCSTQTTYKIKMYDNDGTNNYKISNIVLNSPDEMKTNDEVLSTRPTARRGYQFVGWGTEPNSTVSVRGDRPFVASFDSLYAIWDLETFNITLRNTDPMGSYETMVGNYVDEIYLPDKTYPGFTFLGWVGGPWVTPHKGREALLNTNSGRFIYVASWSQNAYTITEKGLDGANKVIHYNTPLAAYRIDNPTRDGYRFDGWTGTGLTSQTKDLVLPAYTYGDKVYTAHWTKIVSVE